MGLYVRIKNKRNNFTICKNFEKKSESVPSLDY